MRESSTIQALIEEGRVKGLFEEARTIILRLGGIRFGETGDVVVSRLDAISCPIARLCMATDLTA